MASLNMKDVNDIYCLLPPQYQGCSTLYCSRMLFLLRFSWAAYSSCYSTLPNSFFTACGGWTILVGTHGERSKKAIYLQIFGHLGYRSWGIVTLPAKEYVAVQCQSNIQTPECKGQLRRGMVKCVGSTAVFAILRGALPRN